VIKALRDFGTGFGLLARGFGIVVSRKRLLLRGALPALVTLVLLTGGLAALLMWIDELATLVTPFADDWSQPLRVLVRIGAGTSIVLASVALGLVLFTSLTIAIGAPFYESIAEEVEDELGGVPEAERVGWLRATVVGIGDGLRLVFMSLLFSIPLFLAGFIPVVGQTVVPVLAVCVGAWLLAVEYAGIPFTRRGLPLPERRKRMRGRRALVLGFAVPVYLLCLVPFAVLAVVPAAMAGGTLLAHRLLNPTDAGNANSR
jgi:CysZ protein